MKVLFVLVTLFAFQAQATGTCLAAAERAERLCQFTAGSPDDFLGTDRFANAPDEYRQTHIE
ncbi:MAG: hypothetical protein HRT45_00260 [Bdellovibrionales bacterium]|nr:hypothetical protein [Bdellovibrionales bacterium]